MDTRFLPHNNHLENQQRFAELDPDLHERNKLTYIYNFSQIDDMPMHQPGIYTLVGGYKVGKTTLLKSWMEKLLQKNSSPETIVFYPGKLIKDYHELQHELERQIAKRTNDRILFLIIDDVETIHDWKKAVKVFVETGKLEQVVLMLAGSDTLIITNANQLQPTRTSSMDVHLYPLNFRETVLLKHNQAISTSELFEEFNAYLLHGGYLYVINHLARHTTIDDAVFKNYGNWLRDETLKFSKHENFLREILSAVLHHYNDQITWNSLAEELTIDHPKTIGDYFSFLEKLDIVFVQYALVEDELKPAPKKARKIMFTDPFIFHALQAWLASTKNNFGTQVKTTMDNPTMVSKLVESCVASHLRRKFPTYYIKGEGEIDIAYVYDNKFWPIEITWGNQMRAKDLKQILKYPNGRILTKTERSGIIEHIRTEPLPLALWQMDE